MKAHKKIELQDAPVHRIVTDTAWIQGGVVSPQAFQPRPVDKGELSLLDSGKDAPAAHAEWQAAWGERLPGQACLSRKVSDFTGLGVEVYESGSKKLPSHAHADMKDAADVDTVAILLAEDCPVWRPPAA
ncbi:MAG: hypothetical protein Q8P18_26880 [Pseudomonadota bacterium]|nr:hypothetical protein [Pseudomonadota bacterium]